MLERHAGPGGDADQAVPPGASTRAPIAYPVHFEASASDATTGNNGVAFVEYKVNYPGSRPAHPGARDERQPLALRLDAVRGQRLPRRRLCEVPGGPGLRPGQLRERHLLGQDASRSSSTRPASCDSGPGRRVRPPPSATIVSELGVPGGAGQVVANGEAAFPRAGRSPLAVRLEAGGTASRRRSSRPDPPGRGGSSSGACRASVPRAFESSRGRSCSSRGTR